MGSLQSTLDSVRPEMPPELSWAIITLFSVIIVWVTIRYINRLDKILERLDDAIEGINKTLVNLTVGKEDHEKRITHHDTRLTKLEDSNKRRR